MLNSVVYKCGGDTGVTRAGMAEETGRTQEARSISRQQERTAEISALRFTGEKVTTASLEFSNGTKGTQLNVVDLDSNADTREAKSYADKYGFKLTGVSGANLTFNYNGSVIQTRGVIEGKHIAARADHKMFSMSQLVKHEVFHSYFRTNAKSKVNQLMNQLSDAIGRENAAAVLNDYYQIYEGSGLSENEVAIEMLCDMNGGMNIYAEHFADQLEMVDWYEKTLEQASKVTKDALESELYKEMIDVSDQVHYSMYVTQEEINNYVNNAYDKVKQDEFKKYSDPTDRLIEDVKDGLPDISSYHHALRGNDIRHIDKSHGPKTDKKNPVLPGDIKAIPFIVEQYDDVFVQNKPGLSPGLLYVKKTGSDLTYYVEAAVENYGNENLLINKQMIKSDIDTIPDIYYETITNKKSVSEFLNGLKNAPQAYVQDDAQKHYTSDLPQSVSESNRKFSEDITKMGRADSAVLEDKVNDHEAVSSHDEVQFSREFKDDIYNKAVEYNESHGNIVAASTLELAKDAQDYTAELLSKPNVVKLLPEESNVLSGTKDESGNKRTTLFGNSSYGWSAENTTVCIRSLAMEDLLDRVARRLGHSLSVSEAVAVSQMAWSYTDQPTCQYCYVWADRAAERAARNIYIETRNAALEAIGEITPDTPIATADDLITPKTKKNGEVTDRKFLIGQAIDAHPELETQLRAYKDYLGKRDNTINQRERFARFLDNAKNHKLSVSAADVATESDMAKALAEHPELKEEMDDIQRYASNASHAKTKVDYTAYNNDILNISDSTVKTMNDNYGIRFYSYSDFHPAFILENMQMYTDAAVRGLKGLAYTKDLDYARIFAGTGANINISIKAIDGTTEMDAMQGADWEEAKKLRNQYKNVGIIIVATSDAQVNWALDQDWIDVIIPYHVCFSDEVGKIFGWKNYKAVQEDKKIKGQWKEGNIKHITPPLHQNDKTTYLELCKENGLAPRFKKWVDHPNYMKLVNETRQSEADTQKLQPVFDTKYVKKSINDMVKRGGYNNPFGGSVETLNELADEFAERVSSGDNGMNFSREFENARVKSSEELEQAVTDLKERVTSLETDNKELERQKEYFKGQTKLSAYTKDSTAYKKQTPLISEGSAGYMARNIVKRFSSTVDYKELVPDIQKWVTYLASHKDANTFSDVNEGILPMARKLIENASEIVSNDGTELKNYIRSTTIKVSQSVVNDITDWQSWYKSHFGKMRVSLNKGTNISDFVDELYDKYGNYMDLRDLPETDQLLAIADFVDNFEPKSQNPYSYNMAEAIQGAALEIYNELLNAKVFKPTYADRSHATIDRLVQTNNKKIAQIKQQARDDTFRRVQEAKDHAKEVATAARQRRQDSDLRKQLLKLANRADKLKTSKANKAAIQALIQDIDLTAVSMSEGKAHDLASFVAWADEQAANNPDFFYNQKAYSDAVHRLNSTKIKDMSIDDVKDLIQSLRVLLNDIRNENRLIRTEQGRDVKEMAGEISRNIENSRGMSGGIHGKLDDFFVKGTLTPVRFMHRLTGYVDSDPLYRATVGEEGLAGGQRKMLTFQQTANDMFKEWTDDREFTKNITGKKAEVLEFNVTTVDGKKTKIKMTKAMRLSLYMHSKNADSMRHMCGEWVGPSEEYPNGHYQPGGGFLLPNMDAYKKGRLKEAYNQNTQRVRLKKSELLKLFEGMSEKEKAFADRMGEYFNSVSQKAINDVSEDLVGISLAEVKNYYPITVSKNFLGADYGNLKMDGTIEGMGMLKERISSTKPIDIMDATSVLQKSIEATSRYVGLAIPVRNINKLLGVNYSNLLEDGTYLGYDGSVLEDITNKWGNSAKQYIEKMITDIQSPGHEQEKLEKALGKLRSGYAGAVLTWNLSVAMKQAASYPTAAGVLGWEPLAYVMNPANKNVWGSVDLELIKKYTPLQAYRTKGFSTTELGDIQSQNRFFSNLPKGLNWIQGVDVITTRKLWKASEIYVQNNNPELYNKAAGTKLGRGGQSDAYYRAVADIYNQVIEETQPNYTALQRPEYLRSRSGIVQTLMMFKTQPFQNFNVLYDGIFNYKAKHAQYVNGSITKEEFKAAKTRLSRAITSQVGQLITFAAMTMMWNIFRRKEEKYKDDDGNWSLAVMSQNLGKDIASGIAGMIPFGSDIYELFSSMVFGDTYYGFESVTDSAISDLGDSVITAYNLIKSMVNDEDFSIIKYKTKLKSVASAIGKLGGVPVDNIYNLFDALYKQTVSGIGKATGHEEYSEYMLEQWGSYSGDNKKALTSIMMEAYNNGNEEDYEKMYEELLAEDTLATDSKTTQESLDSALKDRFMESRGASKQSEYYDYLYSLYGSDAYSTEVEKAEKFGFTEEKIEDGMKAAYARSVSGNADATVSDAYSSLLDLYNTDKDKYNSEYEKMIELGYTDTAIANGINAILKEQQGVDSVNDLKERYYTPAQIEENRKKEEAEAAEKAKKEAAEKAAKEAAEKKESEKIKETVSTPESSWIYSIGYDEDTGTLTVTTARGTYSYSGISKETYLDFKNAPSKGSWFNAHF